MRVIIAGSRGIVNPILIERAVTGSNLIIDEIISGGAKGVDTMAIEYAKKNNIRYTIFKADWETLGKSAGYKRNITMAEYADALIAIWDGVSKGTKHMVDIAKRRNLKIHILKII